MNPPVFERLGKGSPGDDDGYHLAACADQDDIAGDNDRQNEPTCRMSPAQGCVNQGFQRAHLFQHAAESDAGDE